MTAKVIEKLNELSVVFPCYNEEKNIPELIKTSMKVLPTVANKFEIILVNDGSKDKTSQIAHKYADSNSNIIVVDQQNKGYGGALKAGFKKAKYEWVFFTDADLQFDLSEVRQLVERSRYSSLVIGYRIKRAEGFKRQILASMLKVWNFVFLGFPLYIKDIDCAFKLIHRDVFRRIGELSSDGAMMSTEFLLKSHAAGFRAVQVGVSHYARKIGNPTGNNFKVIFKAVSDTFTLRGMMKTFPQYRGSKSLSRGLGWAFGK